VAYGKLPLTSAMPKVGMIPPSTGGVVVVDED